MTDYLELLLDMRQEEDEDAPFVWKRIRVGYGGLGSEDDRRAAGGEKGKEERNGGLGREDRPWGKEVPEKTRRADPEMRLSELERAVARGRVQQTVQGWRRDHAEMVQAAGGQDMRRLAVTVPGVQRGLAGLLDSAFERDARRYDGPLGLF